MFWKVWLTSPCLFQRSDSLWKSVGCYHMPRELLYDRPSLMGFSMLKNWSFSGKLLDVRTRLQNCLMLTRVLKLMVDRRRRVELWQVFNREQLHHCGKEFAQLLLKNSGREKYMGCKVIVDQQAALSIIVEKNLLNY